MQLDPQGGWPDIQGSEPCGAVEEAATTSGGQLHVFVRHPFYKKNVK